MIKAVIFDMDGTMFDTERVFILAWDYAGEKTGIGKAGHMVMKTHGASIRDSRDIWQREYGNRFHEDEIRKYSKDFITEYYLHHETPIKTGLFELIEYLKNKRIMLGISTSSPRYEVDIHLRSAGLTDCFHAITDRDMVENQKPAPDSFTKTCELLGANPVNCFALEDSKNGILSACSAGCKAIMIPDLWQPDDDTKKLLYAQCDTLHDVIRVIEESMESEDV